MKVFIHFSCLHKTQPGLKTAGGFPKFLKKSTLQMFGCTSLDACCNNNGDCCKNDPRRKKMCASNHYCCAFRPHFYCSGFNLRLNLKLRASLFTHFKSCGDTLGKFHCYTASSFHGTYLRGAKYNKGPHLRNHLKETFRLLKND